MNSGFLEVIRWLAGVLCWRAPFTFVFPMIAAVGETVRGGGKGVGYGVIASDSLLVIIAACVL